MKLKQIKKNKTRIRYVKASNFKIVPNLVCKIGQLFSIEKSQNLCLQFSKPSPTSKNSNSIHFSIKKNAINFSKNTWYKSFLAKARVSQLCLLVYMVFAIL